MRVLVLGGTGMVGHGVVQAAVRDPRVEQVVAIGRRPVVHRSPKLVSVVHADLADLAAVDSRRGGGLDGGLAGFDACFDALGVSSVGMAEPEYRRLTKDLTLSMARAVAAANSTELTFIYVSGAGTDTSEQGRQMWARVKGETENALLAMPMRAKMFRPGIIRPVDGARTRAGWLNSVYSATGPVVGLAQKAFPRHVLDTTQIGRAMVNLAAGQVPDELAGERIFPARAIAALAEQ